MKKDAFNHRDRSVQDEKLWHVSDDLDALPVSAAELDVLEAFLMSLVDAIMDETGPHGPDSRTRH